MGHTLEAIFRRPIRLLIPVVLLPLLGVAIAYYTVPRMYQATASLWALHRYAVIGATGLESDLNATPAETQATALSELLQTRAFALTVAHATNLAPTLNLDSSTMSDTQLLDDTLYSEISRKVQVNAQGYSLFEVSYTNPNPQVAQQVIEAVVDDFGIQSAGFSVVEGQRLLEGYQPQLVTAQSAADAAAKAESQYIAAHPNLTPNQLPNDPQYALLDAKRLLALNTLQNLQNTIATITQAIGSQGQTAASLFQVLDAPQAASRPLSRLKQYLIGGGIGLGMALLACTLYILILVRRDRGMYTALDLQKVTAFPVMMQLPQLSSATVSRLIKRAI